MRTFAVSSAAMAAVLFSFLGVHPERLFDSTTKLGLSDQPIESVVHEMMRRSRALNVNFEAFGKCQVSECWKRFIAERDSIIAEEWPAIYERLVVRSDWINPPKSDEYTRFFNKLEDVGPYRMQYICVPQVLYESVRLGSYLVVYKKRLGGFDCSSPHTPGLRRG
jgi:hypothetical protein